MTSGRTVDDPFFPRLKSHVINSTGMVFYADKDEDLARIVERRQKATGIAGCGGYLSLLMENSEEYDELVAELTIGETYFFRHREQFDALGATVIPDIIRRKSDTRRIRIWSAGCATGAEPYTVAIMLKRRFSAQLAGWAVDILATDINKRFLGLAKRGRFTDWAMRSTPEEVKLACFKKNQGEYPWELAPEYRDIVSFQYHNLVENVFPSPLDNICAFDVILCRNVTIYFERETVRRLVGQFHDSLVDGGWLLPGHAEADMDLFRDFRTVNVPGAVLYQKSAPVFAPVPDFPPEFSSSSDHVAIPTPVLPPPAIETIPESQPVAAAPEPLVHSSFAHDLAELRRLADMGRWREAAAMCRDLLQKDGGDPALHLYQAMALEQGGDGEAAEQSLRRAIFLDRGFALAHYHLGLMLQRRGDKKAAAKSFATVCRLLQGIAPDRPIEEDDGDGMTVGQLLGLAVMHREVLEQP